MLVYSLKAARVTYRCDRLRRRSAVSRCRRDRTRRTCCQAGRRTAGTWTSDRGSASRAPTSHLCWTPTTPQSAPALTLFSTLANRIWKHEASGCFLPGVGHKSSFPTTLYIQRLASLFPISIAVVPLYSVYLCVSVCVLVCFSLCVVIIVFFWLSYLPIQLLSCKSV